MGDGWQIHFLKQKCGKRSKKAICPLLMVFDGALLLSPSHRTQNHPKNGLPILCGPLSHFLFVFPSFLSAGNAGEVEDKLSKVGQKVDEVGHGVGQVVDQLAKTEASQLWCPVAVVGTRCPAGSIFHFYRCCGQLNNECCLKLQTWSFVVLVAVCVLIAAFTLVALLRCIFCRRK